MECLCKGVLCANLRSLTAAIGQLSNRKLCNQICNSVEDGLELEEAGERKTSQDVEAIVQGKGNLRTEPRQGQRERERI